jgi:hypothetical protein
MFYICFRLAEKTKNNLLIVLFHKYEFFISILFLTVVSVANFVRKGDIMDAISGGITY